MKNPRQSSKTPSGSSFPQNAETSTPQARASRIAFLTLLVLCASISGILAQESTKPLRFSFIPPPLDGTFSLGIYDTSGHLVRTLKREAELEDFDIGPDALSLTWDGTNEAGERMPPGKYHARGYVVAAGEVEGIGFHFNDWITDEHSLRIRKMISLAADNGLSLLLVNVGGDQTITIICDASSRITATRTESFPAQPCKVEAAPPQLLDPINCDEGKEKTRWIIDRVAPGSPQTEVKQLSAGKDLLRRLSIPADDPQPRQIAALKDADTIFLLEESGPVQRFRSLTLVPKSGDKEHSDWKVDFEKRIVTHKDFTIENGKPVISGGKSPSEKFTVKLQPNPLKNGARENLDLSVSHDDQGSYLQTSDGLFLQSVSDTPHLTRVVLSPHGENAIDIFQDDDAVVEQFRIGDLDQIMGFDCGEIELK